MRLVHSIDYYNGTVFADEDNMPHRCGIITARPSIPETVTIEDGKDINLLLYYVSLGMQLMNISQELSLKLIL